MGLRLLVPVQLWLAVCSAVHAQLPEEQTTANADDYEEFEAMRAFMQARNAQDYAIIGAHAVDEAKYVQIGGIDQWITIRGEDRDNPVLLFLHGGPGDVTNPWSYAIFRPWLEHFAVVQWDQRGSGRTLGRNDPSVAATITLDRMVDDGIELVEFLRSSLNNDKVIVVAHSFGSLLGVFMVRDRPDLFHAYVGTGQIFDLPRSYDVAYNELLGKAQALEEQRAVDELQAVGPPPYDDGQGYAVQRKWANRFEGADVFIASMLGLGFGAPGYSIRDLDDWFQGQLISSQQLIPETSQLGPEQLGSEFEVPMFVFQGGEDFTTPTVLAERFVSAIRAPRKAFVEIEGGHFAVFTASDQFLEQLVTRVRPLAVTR